MQLSIVIEGEVTPQAEHQRCGVAVDGDTVGIIVTVHPPPGPGQNPEAPPDVRMSSTLLSGRSSKAVPLEPAHWIDGPVKAVDVWTARIPVKVPYFWPRRLRFRVNAGGEQVRTSAVYVIPRSSLWASWVLVVGTAAAITYLTLTRVPAPRLTLLQTLVVVGGPVGSLLLLPLTSSWFAVLRQNVLPLFGLILFPRALAASLLSLALLGGVLNKCIVVVDNSTHDELALSLPWRPEGQDRLPEEAQISVAPEDTRAFQRNPLAFVDRDARRSTVMCVVGTDDRWHGPNACPDFPDASSSEVDDVSLVDQLFAPSRTTFRCGARWDTLDGRNVLANNREKSVRVVRDQVYLHTDDGKDACNPQHARLWYKESAEDPAAHYVQYPWDPAGLRDRQRLWIDWNEGEEERNSRLVLVARRDAGPSEPTHAAMLEPGPAGAIAPGASDHRDAVLAGLDASGLWEETRIALPDANASHGRAWPLPYLDDTAFALRLTVGEHVSEISDPVLPGARLRCERNGARGTGFRATRLAMSGRPGWLTSLVYGPGKVTHGSRWSLEGGTSPSVSAPWICDAFPGNDPNLVAAEDSQAEWMELHVDESALREPGIQSIVVPGHLMAARIDIHRSTERSGTETPPSNTTSELLGTLTCDLTRSARDRIAVGRVILDLGDRSRFGAAKVEVRSGAGAETSVWRPEARAASGGAAPTIWMCWHVDEAHSRDIAVTVSPLGVSGGAIPGSWSPRDAQLELQALGPRICYHDPTTSEFAAKKPPGFIVVRTLAARDFKRIYPGAAACDKVALLRRAR